MRKTKEILLSIVVVLICFAAIGFSERNPVKAESAEWEILYPDINVYEAQSLIKDRNGNIWNSIIENTGYGVFHKLYKNGTLMSNFQLGIYDCIVDIDEDADGFIWAAVRYGWGETYMPTRVAKINPSTGYEIDAFILEVDSYPTGIAIDKNTGTLYVIDQHSSDIKYYDIDSGSVTDVFNYNYPTMLCDVDVDSSGNLWICCDEWSNKIIKFNPAAEIWQEIDMPDYVRPHGIDCDNNGDVWITDSVDNRVFRYFAENNEWVVYSDENFNGPIKVFVDENYTVYCMDASRIYFADFPSPECYVLQSVSPEDAVIQDNSINAADTMETSLTIDVTVSANADWELYADSECTQVIDKMVSLELGANTFYIKVTAEDSARTKVYSFNITRYQKTITVYIINCGKVYGDPDPEFFEYEISGDLDPGDTVTGQVVREPGEDAGEYEFSMGTLTAPPKYNIILSPADFNISTRLLKVIAEPKTKTYGSPDPELTYHLSDPDTLQFDDTFECELQRLEGEDAGTYYIELAWRTVNPNYSFMYQGANFTILKKDVTVTADAMEKIYGSPDPVLTYSASGLIEGDGFSGALSRTEGETVGEYDINLGNLTAGDNYNVLFTGAKFNILWREITIEGVSAVDRQYDGTVLVELTGVISGIIEGDDVSLVLTGYINSPNASPEPYNVITGISLDGADSGNYVFTQELTGITVTITPQQVVVYWPTETFIYNGSVQFFYAYYYDVYGNIQYTYVEVGGEFKNAGTYTATAVVTTEGPNYQFIGDTKELTIEPLQIEFTYFSIDISRYYNGSDIAQVYYMTNIPYGEDWVLEVSARFDTPNVTANSVNVECILHDKNNYKPPESYTITEGVKIRPKPIEAHWNHLTDYIYNGQDQSDTVSAYYFDIYGNQVPLAVEFETPFIDFGLHIGRASMIVPDINYIFNEDTLTRGLNIMCFQIEVYDLIIQTEKIYDTKTDAVIEDGWSTNIIDEDLIFTVTATYNTSDVTAYKITVKFEMAGDKANNYWLPLNYTINDAKINPKPVPVMWSYNENYTYNGMSQSASVTAGYLNLNGISPALSVNFSGEFKNAGLYNVTAEMILLNSNYVLTDTEITLEIKPLEINVQNLNIETVKSYDGTDTAHVAPGWISNIIYVGGQLYIDARYSTKDVGASVITVTFDSDDTNGNYDLPDTITITENVAINPKTLTLLQVTAADKVYDGTNEVSLSGGVLNGVIEGEDVTFALVLGTVSSPDASPNPYNVTVEVTLNGADSINYILTQPDYVTVMINPLDVWVHWQYIVEGYYYNGKDQGGTVSAYYLDINSQIIPLTVTFDREFKHNGNYQATALMIEEDFNYRLTNDALALNISKVNVELYNFEITKSKVFDGTTDAQISDYTSNVDESVTLTARAYYNTQNVGADTIFVIYQLAGDIYEDYILPATQVITQGVSITPKEITINWIHQESYTYNRQDQSGTVKAYYTDINNYVIWLDVSFDGEFKNAGSYTATAQLTLNPNYNFSSDTFIQLEIERLQITVDVEVVKTKVYDGSSEAEILSWSSNIIDGDGVTLQISANFNHPNTYADWIIVDYVLLNDDFNNYIVPVYDRIYGAEIRPLSVDVIWHYSEEGYTYNGQDRSGTVTAEYLDINGNAVPLAVNFNYTFKNAGDYTATATKINSDNNYRLVGETLNLTMSPFQIEVYNLSVETEKTYDGTYIAFIYDGWTTNIPDGEMQLSVSASFNTADVSASSILVTYLLQGDTSGNYAPPAAHYLYNVRITPAESEVIWEYQTYTYNGGDQSAGVTAKYIAINGEEVTLSVYFGGEFKNAALYSVKAEMIEPDANYTLTNDIITLEIKPLKIVVENLSVETVKTYDGGDSAQVNAGWMTNIIVGEAELIAEAHYNTKNTNASSITVTFALAQQNANYDLPDTVTITENVAIIAKTIDISQVSAINRRYDGTNLVVLTGGVLNGVINGDQVSFVLGVGTISSPNASAVLYNVTTAITLNGTDSQNYKLTQPDYVFVKISPETVEVIWEYNVNGYIYNGLDQSANIRAYYVDSGNNEVALSVDLGGEFKNAGEYSATARMTEPADYILENDSITVYIIPLQIEVFGLNVIKSKVYDGNTAAAISQWASNIVDEDVILTVRAYYNSKNTDAGSISVTFELSGDIYGNYNAPSDENITEGVAITPLQVTAGGYDIVTGKVYDGTDAAQITGACVTNIIDQEVTLVIDARFNSSHCGADGITVSFALNGDVWGNYIAPKPVDITQNVSITPKTVAVNWHCLEKYVYNGADQSYTISATFTDVDGVVRGMTVSVDGGVFKDAGDYLITAVFESEFNDYNFEGGATELTINPLKIAVESLNVETVKVYDGTDVARVFEGWTSNIIGGEAELQITARFNTENVTAGTITVTFEWALQNGNYTLPYDITITQNVAITPRPLTVSQVEAASRQYNGTDVITLSGGVLNGVIDGDNVTFTLNVGTVSSPNAALSPYDVTTNITLDGADKANYTLIQPDGLKAAISPMIVDIEWCRDDFTYNGTDQKSSVTATYKDIGNYTVYLDVTPAGGAFINYNVDGYTFTASLKFNEANYALPSNKNMVYHIKKAVLIDISQGYIGQYDGNTHGISVMADNFAGDDDLSLATLRFGLSPSVFDLTEIPVFTDVGVHVVYYRMTFDNYTAIEGSKVVAIIPKEVETVWNYGNFVYNGNDRSNEVSAYYTDVNSEQVPLQIGFSDLFRNVGEYTVMASLIDGNYTLKNNIVTISIAPLQIVLNNFEVEGEKQYDKTNIAGVSNWTSNIVGGEVTLTVEALYNANDITANRITVTFILTGSKADNYNMPENYVISENVRIMPRELSVTDIIAKSRQYDGTNVIEVEGCILVGICEGDEVGYILGDGYVESADASDTDYDVNAPIQLTGNSAVNYTVLPCELKAKISRREITVKIDNKSSREGENLLPLTYSLTAGDIIQNDVLNITLHKETGTEAGFYNITGTFDNPNYAVTWIDGVYTIYRSQIEQTEQDGDTVISKIVVECPQGLTPDVEIVIIDQSAYYKRFAITSVFGKSVINRAFNICLRNCNGEEVPLNGKVTVKLLIDEELRDRNDLKVVYIGDDGNITDMNAVRLGDYLIFETNHFSVYAIVTQEPGSGIELIIATSVMTLVAVSVIFILIYRKRLRARRLIEDIVDDIENNIE